MPNFTYIALDARGQQVTGVIEAASQNEAVGALRQAGYFPKSVDVETKASKAKATKTVAKASSPPAAKGGFSLFKRQSVKAKVLMIFTRQLATLIDAGLPLLRSLTVL